MLSNRLHLMTCLALLLLPVAVASGAPDAEELRDEAVDTALTTSEDTYREGRAAATAARDEARYQANVLLGEADAARRDVEHQRDVAVELAEHHLEVATVLVVDSVDNLVHEVAGVRDEAERRIPALYQTRAEDPSEASGDAAMEPQTSAAVPLTISEPLLLVSATAAAAGLLFWLAGSTGAAKAGSAATGMAGKNLKDLLPYASPLFTRFERDTVLGHPKRESLYAEIMSRPGVTLQDLCEETGLSRTAVSHHLRLLEQQHLIVSKRMGRSRHFFENGGRYGRDQKDAYAVLHNDRSKDVHEYIADHPGAIQKDLCDALGIQASVAHWHVKRLQEASLIESVRQGRTVSYFPTQAAAYA